MIVTDKQKENWMNAYNEKRKKVIEVIEGLVFVLKDEKISLESRELIKKRINEFRKKYNILDSEIKNSCLYDV
jgi:hypothetical protein